MEFFSDVAVKGLSWLVINIRHHDRRGREMDEAQEGGQLKRHMKGQHIERREM